MTEPPLETTTTVTMPPSTVSKVVETTISTTEAPATTTTEDEEELLAGMRDELVDLQIQRGVDPAEAEVEADRLMTEGADSERLTEIMDRQLELYQDWMTNYPLHPVIGGLWTEEQASCAIIEMMKQSGVARTERLLFMADPVAGGMNEMDATASVQPIADCVDLRAMTLEAMTIGGADSPECLLGSVSEEQIVLWYAAMFMDGQEAYWNAVEGDLDLTCLEEPGASGQ